jgi:serine O-acetyltransferase
VFERLREDIAAIRARDPAARSSMEILFCYPGLHAVIWHRISSWFWRRHFYFFGRLFSHIGRILTGIEIHPGAKIGRRVFIDHGMGCVIGETADVGDDVTLYHDVTLGGISLEQGKRHPTLEAGVIVGAGAQILGPITVGAGARVGANAVVLKDVPAGVTMVGIPARQFQARPRTKPRDFDPYGTPVDGVSDPVANTIRGLLEEVESLRRRIDGLENDSEGDKHSSDPDDTAPSPDCRT